MTTQIGEFARATFGFDRAAFRRDIGEIIGGNIAEAASAIMPRWGDVIRPAEWMREPTINLGDVLLDLGRIDTSFIREWERESLQRSLLSFNQINPSQED